ncbi:SCO family protein [Bacillaceae bacterium SIJ1]|uniref:SCO family protein n=1 Tax=Litoribacterium kuwaitense TaxID=1398745 RepID=UPI0013EBA4C8|nr:SCO family protein [Litoribacterium kuwaitense]NGP45393.1 SCO family protein [Litoribacterium kuwaitense]
MKFTKAYVSVPLIILMVILVGLVLWLTVLSPQTGGSQQEGGPAVAISFDDPVPTLSGVNQEGEPFSTDDMNGEVWVADFIFTNCPDVCPPMTFNMSRLQDKAKEADLDVTFVSFSVDPTRDQPEVLKEFGETFNADFSNWHFVTGYSPEEVKSFPRTLLNQLFKN